MQEEISLREVILTLWSRKTWIILITAGFFLASVIANWWVLDPVYQAESTLRVNMKASDETSLLTSLVETATNDVNINNMIEKLNLDRSVYQIESIRKALKVELSKDNKVMKIIVKGTDPAIITKIANHMAIHTGTRLEISDLSNEIIKLMMDKTRLENEMTVLNQDLAEIRKLLSETEEFITIKQVLSSDPFLQSIVSEQTGLPVQEIAGMQLESQIRNPVYTNLSERLAAKQIDLSNRQATLGNVEKLITQYEEEIRALEHLDGEFLDSTKSNMSLNGKSAIFISPAMEPESPVEPHKVKNVVLTTGIGAVLAAVYVFFREYLKVDFHLHESMNMQKEN